MSNSIISMLLANDSFIVVNKNIIKILDKDLPSAVMLCHLITQYNYFSGRNALDKEGYFYCTLDDLSEIGIKRHSASVAAANLKKFGIIQTKVKGLPARTYYKVNLDIVENLLKELKEEPKKIEIPLDLPETSLQKSANCNAETDKQESQDQQTGEQKSENIYNKEHSINHNKEEKEKEKEKAVSEEPISETPVSPSSAILDSVPEKTEVTPQEKADLFIAEYKRLYKEKEGIALIDRYVFTITDSIGKVLDFDLTKLQTLFENYKRSWWTVEKNIRATPDNVFKFLDKSSDSLKSEFKGQEKSRYKDENGNYTNQDGASEWYKKDWARMRAEAEQRAIQPMTPEDEALARLF